MAKESRSLSGKVAAITGGRRGIGRATAPALAAAGSQSTGIRSRKFIRNTRQKIVIASGAISRRQLRRIVRDAPALAPLVVDALADE